MLISILRVGFIAVIAALAVRITKLVGPTNALLTALSFIGILLAGVVVVVVDLLTPRKKIQTISAVYFGLIVGLLLSSLFQTALEPTLTMVEGPEASLELRSVGIGLMTVALCYICVSLLLQTKDDFRFLIPYVEFAREMKGTRPLLLDTSVIIDGRVADVADSHLLDQPLLVPRFVLQELQAIADSSDKLRRNRGRRGLDILNRLQKAEGLEVRIHDGEPPDSASIREVDQRLVLLAKHLGGKVVTNDYNLNKIAKFQGVEVINLNDVANALKPVVLPGEPLTVKLIRRGEEPGQGVGYLDDGTMVVVEQGLHFLGEHIRLTVTSVLQTSAGRMIFGRLEGPPARAGQSPSGDGSERPSLPQGQGQVPRERAGG